MADLDPSQYILDVIETKPGIPTGRMYHAAMELAGVEPGPGVESAFREARMELEDRGYVVGVLKAGCRSKTLWFTVPASP